ncbi:MAG: hypothetical protein ABW140_10695 [Candidatus Sedimenticola sp. 6PFRAG1]
MSFSERYGYKPVRDMIQIESMDEPLKNGLWSLLKVHAWDHARYVSEGFSGAYYLNVRGNEDLRSFCNRLWFNYFKEPLDDLGNDWSRVLGRLREHFYSCEWFEVYDFIEFVVNNYDRREFKNNFTQACNNLLEKEMSAYRFVNNVITRITEKEEIEEVERALEGSSGPVSTHLGRSLELLSDRNAPDYRNSIKESISAVESMVANVVGAEKGTLGQLVKKLNDEINLHPALQKAFSSLYGYTSDEGGIRHALMELRNNDFNDAKFMLVVCSAFINFVEGKSKSAG